MTQILIKSIYPRNLQAFILSNKKGISQTYIKLLKNIKFNTNNTVGPKSISKQELIKEFNNYII